MSNEVSVIQLDNVSVKRQGRVILENISWDVLRGEHWALIGPNGSGKSLTLSLLAGYLWATTGTVSVLGHRFGTYDLRELRKQIGWVSLQLQYECTTLGDTSTALDIVLSGHYASLGLYEDPPDTLIQQARQTMSKVHCEHLAERSFATLSWGEQKRVLIARALLPEPALLILDEPCTGLDLASREDFLSLIQHLGEQPDGPTLLHVTHHIEELMPCITHCLCLKDGKVTARGDKETVLSASVLSETLGMPLQIDQREGRYWVQLAPSKILESQNLHP